MAKKMPSSDKVMRYYEYILSQENSGGRNRAINEWRENIALYNDEYEFEEKLKWQNTMKDPLTDNLIVRITNFFSRILITTDDEYFTISHKQGNIASGIRSIVKAVFRDNNYPAIFSDSLKWALLTAPYVNKVQYQYNIETYPTYDDEEKTFDSQEERIGRTTITRVDPRNLYLDPDGDSFIREEKHVDIADFKRMARGNGWTNVSNVVIDSMSADDDDSDNFRPKVTLDYVYAKALTSKTGEILDKNCYFIIANREYIVFYGRNLLPNGEFPYVVGFPMKSLTGRYGRGYISKLRDVILTYIEALNLSMDAFTLATLGAYEVDHSKIRSDSAHMFTSIKPGRMYPVNELGALQRVFDTEIDPLAIQLLFVLDRLIQNRSFQNEFFQGRPTAKGRPTAREISIKTQESNSFFTDIASEIERSVIEPLIRLVVATELIHIQDEDHINLDNVIESQEAFKSIKGTGFGDRVDMLKESTIEARGISGKVLKLGNFNKIIQILNVLGNMPQLLAAFDPVKLVQRVFEGLDESPDSLMNMDMVRELSQNPVSPQDIVAAQQQGGTENLGNIAEQTGG